MADIMRFSAKMYFYPGVSDRDIFNAFSKFDEEVSYSPRKVSYGLGLQPRNAQGGNAGFREVHVSYSRYDGDWDSFVRHIKHCAKNLDGLCLPVKFEVPDAYEEQTYNKEGIDEDGTWFHWAGGKTEEDKLICQKQFALDKAINQVEKILKDNGLSDYEISIRTSSLRDQKQELDRLVNFIFSADAPGRTANKVENSYRPRP